MTTLADIQRKVGVVPDGAWGPRTAEAIDRALDELAACRRGSAPQAGSNAYTGMIDADLLAVAVPSMPIAERVTWAAAIRRACEGNEINTIRRIAAFIAQMAHESAGFIRLEENLNYSAERMAQVWSRFAANPAAATKDRVPNDLARSLAHNPEALANVVYADRLGNGPPESGDGWAMRGGGPLQVTGRTNWTAFAASIGKSLADALAYGRTIEGGVAAAAWFWEANDINRLADTPGTADETKAINGGTIGLAERTAIFDRLVAAMLKREGVA